MTFAELKNNIDPGLEEFNRFDTDTQLALLWFLYTKMGGSITPAAPGAAAPQIAEGLYNQIKERSHEEQLQLQRDFLEGTNNEIAREYGSLSDNTKLLLWYRLAQGMETKEIVPMPEDYELNKKADTLLAAIETLDFEQQITFLRRVVSPTGSQQTSQGNI
ncbi:orange carotenoid protein N-terminal domain-containing protein [Capilliphycus salinus ALCB114379]|uniref:orange carotenoid protein N-terminal domain-containing protein n=1 Tax=Capilliphycus salinus TaxID=2768948 RepID=UPI0039A553E4